MHDHNIFIRINKICIGKKGGGGGAAGLGLCVTYVKNVQKLFFINGKKDYIAGLINSME